MHANFCLVLSLLPSENLEAGGGGGSMVCMNMPPLLKIIFKSFPHKRTSIKVSIIREEVITGAHFGQGGGFINMLLFSRVGTRWPAN